MVLSALLSTPVMAAELRTGLLLLGQVRDGDQSRQTEVPVDFYGNLGVTGLHHGSELGTYFRLQRDFSLDQGAADFYAGYLRVPGAIPGVDFTVGRQFLSEVPGGAFVADAGKIRLDLGGPVAFTVFGGQPQYFEPTFSSDIISQDEIIFGGSMRTTHLHNGVITLGYLQQERDQKVLRQLISGSFSRAFTRAPGLPTVYGTLAYDADRQNIDRGTLGFDVFLSQPRLSLNFESGYYKPQDQGERVIVDLNRREDPIFELFSISELLQFRGGLRYTLSPELSAYGGYSFQTYDRTANDRVDGHLGNAGLVWLPGGDGLEVVGAEYYVIDSKGGTVNGGRAYYENRVYRRILFQSKVDVAYYDKESNQHDTAVSSLLGLGYDVLPGLLVELTFEANHNMRFNEDYRFGFLVSYNGRLRSGDSRASSKKEPS